MRNFRSYRFAIIISILSQVGILVMQNVKRIKLKDWKIAARNRKVCKKKKLTESCNVNECLNSIKETGWRSVTLNIHELYFILIIIQMRLVVN